MLQEAVFVIFNLGIAIVKGTSFNKSEYKVPHQFEYSQVVTFKRGCNQSGSIVSGAVGNIFTVNKILNVFPQLQFHRLNTKLFGSEVVIHEFQAKVEVFKIFQLKESSKFQSQFVSFIFTEFQFISFKFVSF